MTHPERTLEDARELRAEDIASALEYSQAFRPHPDLDEHDRLMALAKKAPALIRSQAAALERVGELAQGVIKVQKNIRDHGWTYTEGSYFYADLAKLERIAHPLVSTPAPAGTEGGTDG